MRKVMRIAKRIIKEVDTESCIYDRMWCELVVHELIKGKMLVQVKVATNIIFYYIITIPKYAKLSGNDLLVTCDRCFEEVKKVFIDTGFEIKEPSIDTNLYGGFMPYASFHFVF